MTLKRIMRHLLTTHAQVSLAFPPASLQVIEQAVAAAEASHRGEIRFAVEGALDGMPLFRGQSSRERAIEVFSLQRVWDTEHNSGLLIYLLLADRAVEIVADRGIHARVGSDAWDGICRQMEDAFGQGKFEQGAVAGIKAVTQHLVLHFPAGDESGNELANAPVML